MDNGNHFSIKRHSSVAPEPTVIDMSTLDQALHPTTPSLSTFGESRETTPGYDREPKEILYLRDLNKLSISHNIADELFNCCQMLNFHNLEDSQLVMRATKKVGCSHQNIEIFNLVSRELAMLIEITDGSLASSVPTGIQIYGPPGKSLGFVDRYAACGSDNVFEIRNANGDAIYTTHPVTQCCQPTHYSVISKDNNLRVAEIIAGGGWICGFKVCINFIENIPPSQRALIIGLALLVDMAEWKQKSQQVQTIGGIAVGIVTVLGALKKQKIL